MQRSNRPRRVLALLAAYVVVLQALLLPLTVAAGAAYDPAICISSVSAAGGAPEPASHSGCGCAAGCGMHCGAQSMGEPPPSLAALLPAFALVTVPALPFEAVARAFEKRPQNPRAPPAF